MSKWCRHVHVRPQCFILTEACTCGLELVYFAGKISKSRLVCKNAVALAYYGSCRLLVMGSWQLLFFWGWRHCFLCLFCCSNKGYLAIHVEPYESCFPTLFYYSYSLGCFILKLVRVLFLVRVFTITVQFHHCAILNWLLGKLKMLTFSANVLVYSGQRF